MKLTDPILSEQMCYLADTARKALGADIVVIVAQIREKKSGKLGSLISYSESEEAAETDDLSVITELLLKAAHTIMSTETDLEVVVRNKKTGNEFFIKTAIINSGEVTHDG